MITRELVDRINFLARKQRTEGLNEAEKEEQRQLRERYLAGIRAQVIQSLEAAGFKPRTASHRPLTGEVRWISRKGGRRCSCGAGHPKHHDH
ncbi:hypothetical protein J2Z49_002192 [Desulfofundulus luciae]|uniref:UPF0291 protein J2Z49_002192 n=1 Tax=Desulfofundulus luciae TaxID=74702 RepID=A0ABU0B2X4_9FIRM|nr:DUF896 domain-containing protein [Desulfofundulus luciae]MDQ0287075.1 hypothetical protein [Desulfofundulus luciae]